MKLFETVILALLTLSHTHTHTAVNEGGVHPPGLLYYICSQLLAEWKKERRRREDFTVTKWSEGFGGGGHATLVEDKANNCSRLQHPWAEEVCGPGRGVQQPITKRTQTTGRQKQTRQGTEPICSASRVSAHFAQTGGRAQPLTAETPLILTQIKKKRFAARSLSVFSELLHTCNTSLSLIVWRGTKASQGGVGGEKKEKKKVFDGDIKHAIKESGIMRHLLTFVCTTLCLQLIFGSFLTGSFLPSILIALEDWDIVFQDCCIRRFRPSVWRWIPLTDRLGRIDLHYKNWELIVSVLCARFIWLLAFSTTDSSPRRQTSTTSALLQETQCARTHSWTLNRCDTD